MGKPDLSTPPGGEALEPQFGILRLISKVLSSDNPLMALIEGLFNFLKDLFSPGNSGDDVAGSEAQRREQQERVERERKEAEQRGLYNKDPKANAPSATDLAALPPKLLDMRKKAEEANGGKKVEPIMPIEGDGRITESFGHREKRGEHSSTNHQGIDVATSTPGGKTKVVATMPGVVLSARYEEGYGYKVETMDVYGVRHVYGHMDADLRVRKGDEIKQGQQLGVMGATGWATGVHLHYEQIKTNGERQDPILRGKTWKDKETFKANEGVPPAPERPAPERRTEAAPDAVAQGAQAAGAAMSGQMSRDPMEQPVARPPAGAKRR